jgi:hypothetical protein
MNVGKVNALGWKAKIGNSETALNEVYAEVKDTFE